MGMVASKKPSVSPSTEAQLEGLAKQLTNAKVQRVLIMAGAGISTSAGIPDFRSPVTGLYASLAKYDLPYPEALFDIGFFRENPQPFYTLYKELYPDGSRYKPTLTHCFFRLLEKKGKLLRVFTQNIDTLELLGGLSPDMLVEAHGSFAKARCIECKTEVDDDWLKEKVMSGSVARCEQPKCQKKDQVPSIKPDIVFFGENLPDRFFERLMDFRRAQVLLVMGTSLVVNPFASLIDEVPLRCPRYLFNLDRVGESRSGGFLSRFDRLGGGGFDFNEDSRDVFCQGKVDDTIRVLAQKCGWEEELDSLYNELHAQPAPESTNKESAKDSASSDADQSDGSSSGATDALAEQLQATKLDARTDAKSEKL
ncbi:Sir2 histone deacetylase Hst2 [Malassezia furfur]|uniref:NAD-dependent protein deacetylase n=1 Tax=Malassezia furfur TaxID=55194 RepID=A0ABY8EQF4_MALFU|nr:Sir2 histone deacetylase Hst2 [Malassezia furfur]